tara:strand:+ start:37 stop:1224 length:1188 start_codon:yes stop_codon:yes gene_type:complete
MNKIEDVSGRNIPGRMTGFGKVLEGSRNVSGGQGAAGVIDKALKPGLVPTNRLPTQILSRMGNLGKQGGLAGLLAAGAYGLFEIGRQTGFEPEKLGAGAASVKKSIEEVTNEAVEVAKELGQPVLEYVDKVIQGYQSEMSGQGRAVSDMDRAIAEPLMMANGDEAVAPTTYRSFLDKGTLIGAEKEEEYLNQRPDLKNILQQLIMMRNSMQPGNPANGKLSEAYDAGLQEAEGLGLRQLAFGMDNTSARELFKNPFNMDTSGRNMMAKGGEAFPDLTGDGKVTQADILKGRGVYAAGDEVQGMMPADVSRETNPDEVAAALSSLEAVQPETEMINEIVGKIVEMLEAGASEEEIIAMLGQMGLDQEDIKTAFEIVAEMVNMENQNPIDAQLNQIM